MLGLGLGHGVRLGGGAALRRRGLVLDADPTWRGPVLDASPLTGRMQSWTNDPPSADRVGRYRAGGPYTVLTDKAFASIYTFTRASKATEGAADSTLVELAVDAIRQGYDPATLLPVGWLIEGASSNLAQASEDPSDPFYSKNGYTPTPGAVVGPGGTLNGALCVEAVTADRHTLGRTYTVADASLPYTHYVIAKQGPGTKRYLRVYITNGGYQGGSRVAGTFDLSSGTMQPGQAIGTGATLLGVKMVPLRDGWYLCSVTATMPAGTSIGGWVGQTDVWDNGSIPNSYTGDGVSGLYYAGVQFEQNYYPSSYFKTLASGPGTRAADVLLVDGGRFSQMFGAGAPQGAVFFDVVLPQLFSPSGQLIVQIDTGAQSSRLQLYNVQNTSNLGCFATVNGPATGSTSPNLTGLVAGTPFRVGLKWNTTGFAICKDGGAIASVVAPSAAGSFATMRIGNNFGLTNPLNGRIRYAGGASYAPSDAQFQAACALGADLKSILG